MTTPNARSLRAILRIATVALPAFGLASQSAVAGSVDVFPAKGVDFSAYKTYKILPPRVLTKRGLREDDPTVGPAIVEALRKQLAAKGLTEVTDGADLLVSSGASAIAIPQIEMLIYYPGFHDSSITGTAPLVSIGRYNREGTLMVNLIDSSNNKSAWLGLASRALGKPEKVANDVNKAAAAMFKKYPGTK